MNILKIFTTAFLTLSLFLVPFANAIEKERLQAFFKEYDASPEKKALRLSVFALSSARSEKKGAKRLPTKIPSHPNKFNRWPAA